MTFEKNLSMAISAAKLCNLSEKNFNSLKKIKNVEETWTRKSF